jgi:glutathione S-transferase
VLPVGAPQIEAHVPEILEAGEQELPVLLRQVIRQLYEHLQYLAQQGKQCEALIQSWHRQSEASQRLAAIPGVGLLTATALVATVGDARQYRTARQFAASLGLVPRQHSSGGKFKALVVILQERHIMNELVLYAFKSRSRAERVLWVLQELRLPHRIIRLDYTKEENTSAAYLKLNPAGKIPTLVHGDFVLTESMAICFYLCSLSDNCFLIPEDANETAVFYQRVFFALTEVEPYLWLSDKERFIKDEEMPSGVADYAIRQVQQALTSVNRWLEHAPYIAGAKFSLADILYYHLLVWSHTYDIPHSQTSNSRSQDK